MSDITVNVSIEDLKRFLSFISNFKRNIEEDCEQLLVALKKLSVTMDSNSIFEINQSVNKIANILDINQKELFELYGKIEEYYLFIKKLQEVSDSQPSRPTVIPSQSVNHQPIYTTSKMPSALTPHIPSATTYTSSVPNAALRFDTQKVNRVAYQLQQHKKELPFQFSRKSFKYSNSFDAKAKENNPGLNSLKNRCVYDVPPMGSDMKAIDRSPKDEYTQEERKLLKEIRDKIDAPTIHTVMQKVVGVDTGDIHKDLKAYFEPKNFEGKPCEAHVAGCVTKAADAVPFTKTPKECFDNLRLDYDPGHGRENPYKSPEQAVYVVRFTDGTNYDIPYSKEFDKDAVKSLAAPMTGNGLTGSKKHVIPEYVVRPENKKGAIVTDGEIYKINPDGSEEKVAYYNKKHHCFKPCKEDNQ